MVKHNLITLGMINIHNKSLQKVIQSELIN